MTENLLLEVSDLSVAYRTKTGLKQAVSGASLQLGAGETTAIVGESGSGKSTLARAIVDLLPANATVQSGSVKFDGRNLRGLHPREWYDLRGAEIGWVPQDPTASLNPMKSVGSTVAEALHIHGWEDRPARKKRVHDLLERVGFDDPELRASQFPHQLSGGMKQRVLIAAALALEPRLVIADEPTSALDVTVQQCILDLLDDLREETGAAVLLITHDLAVAGERSDQVVVMEQAQVRETGTPARVLGRPKHAYTRQLIADAPSFSAAPIGLPEATGEVLLDVRGLTQEFNRPGLAPFRAVDDVSFQVRRGATHGIVGESGSGKTTTGRAITMFQEPSSGQITLDGRQLLGLGKREQRALRPQVQLVYQNPHGSLDPRRKISSIIADPLRNYGRGSRKDIQARVGELLDRVGLPSAVAQRRPSELSGGQLQRIAIARALILEPQLVVFDEAVSALDVTVQAQILRLLAQLQEDLDLTYVFISHDLAVVRQIAQSVSVLSQGRQVEVGATEDVLLAPQHEYTQQLITAVPRGLRNETNPLEWQESHSRPKELAVVG